MRRGGESITEWIILCRRSSVEVQSFFCANSGLMSAEIGFCYAIYMTVRLSDLVFFFQRNLLQIYQHYLKAKISLRLVYVFELDSKNSCQSASLMSRLVLALKTFGTVGTPNKEIFPYLSQNLRNGK